MIVQFTLASQSDALLQLVGDFAAGLECEVAARATPRADVHARLPQDAPAELLLHLLSYVALSTVKLGLDVKEPRYQVRFREPKAKADVALTFGVSGIELTDAAGS
jgi:hypothetical protein